MEGNSKLLRLFALVCWNFVSTMMRNNFLRISLFYKYFYGKSVDLNKQNELSHSLLHFISVWWLFKSIILNAQMRERKLIRSETRFFSNTPRNSIKKSRKYRRKQEVYFTLCWDFVIRWGFLFEFNFILTYRFLLHKTNSNSLFRLLLSRSLS